MPCRGCFGPVDGVKDAGLKMVSTISAIIDADNDSDLAKISSQIVDLAGYSYRFTLPTSLLGSLKRRSGAQGEQIGK
jgi:F420-non-reducing hydrogenase small subunit